MVADDRRLVLEVVVEAEPPAGEVLPDDGHAEIGSAPAAVLLRQGVAVMAGGVGPATHLVEQRFPILVGQAGPVPVGAGVLPAVAEEAEVVVLALERRDLPLDNVVELGAAADEV